MASAPRHVTLHDVARRANVSYQTVSRVINDHPYVAAETRERVLDAIQALNYRPNKAAKSLAARRSQTLAIITYGMDYYGPAQMVIHIERAARRAGYDLIFSNVSTRTDERMRAAVNSLSGWQVDGILVLTPVISVGSEDLGVICGETPVVQIDNELGSAAASVVMDQSYGSELVTQHLIDLGHARIVEISGPQTWHGALARHRSWRRTILRAGLEPGPSLEGDWTAMSGYEAARELLIGGVDFTAVVVGNDQMALGVMRALHEHGLRIPEDVSVVGFDDVPEAVCYEPPLTTVRQDFGALGKKGVECLMERIAAPEAPQRQHVIYPQLVLRQSTASPRTGMGKEVR